MKSHWIIGQHPVSSKQLPDPRAIFQHAEAFYSACWALRAASSSPPLDVNIASPLVVLTCFNAELYLKTLLMLEGKRPPNTHDLFDLFKKLSPSTQDAVEEEWDIITELREPMNKDLDAQLPTPIPRDLRGAIKESRDSHDRLRYVYEAGKQFRFVVGDLPMVLRRVILGKNPTWGQDDGLYISR